MPPRPRPLPQLGCLLALAACYTPVPPPEHDPHVACVAVTIADGGIEPAPDVHVAPFSVVVFRNATAAGITVHVDRPITCSVHCDTSMGFGAEGNACSARTVPPEGAVSLCFHDPGSFAYEAKGGERTWRGVVHVGPAAGAAR